MAPKSPTNAVSESTESDSAEIAAQGDGRRQRSERSRAKIVAAMFSVIRGGEMDPSAATLAEEAKVGIRTVFRHFDDVDSLYREMSAQMEAEILPIVSKPFAASTWQGRLSEMIDRRVNVYERIMPIKTCAGLRRFRSEYLMQDYQRFLSMERDGLARILPSHIKSDKTLFAALEMLTGFNAWRRFRQDQQLTAKQAEKAIRFSVEKLVAE
ncbi:MAG: TetR/AcrR family transcriptional regulator [Pseudomonadota bacterium]